MRKETELKWLSECVDELKSLEEGSDEYALCAARLVSAAARYTGQMLYDWRRPERPPRSEDEVLIRFSGSSKHVTYHSAYALAAFDRDDGGWYMYDEEPDEFTVEAWTPLPGVEQVDEALKRKD